MLLTPRLEHFNLDVQSEGLLAPQSDELPQVGDSGGRGRTPPIYYELTKNAAGVGAGEAQATRLPNVHHGGGGPRMSRSITILVGLILSQGKRRSIRAAAGYVTVH